MYRALASPVVVERLDAEMAACKWCSYCTSFVNQIRRLQSANSAFLKKRDQAREGRGGGEGQK